MNPGIKDVCHRAWLFIIFFETGFSLNLDSLTAETGWLESSYNPPVSEPFVLRLQECATTPSLYMGDGDLNSSPQVSTVGT